ncbi:MAG: hypothetical protein JNK02_14750 [Planctomycetes bacterium]|nr:hypothetical protein [Planctomycetota bacterium]
MPLRRRRAASAPLLAALLSAAAAPRSNAVVVELEPNGTKPEATLVACLGDATLVQGVTLGAGTAPQDASPQSADTWRLQLCPRPAGIWRHRLVLATQGPPDHALSIRGLGVNGPPSAPSIAVGTDLLLQSAVAGPGSTRFVQWYGFGRGEELYVRVAGTPDTVGPYALALESAPVNATPVPGTLRAGRIEITTVGQGHATDTEIFVYDGALQPIPGFRNDDAPGDAAHRSLLARTFAPGVYFVAIGRFNVADALLTGADDAYPLAPVLDFPDLILSWSPSGGTNVSFALTDELGTIQVPAALPPEPFAIAWFRLVVTEPPVPVVATCFGDGTGTPCPCGNSGAAGRGCANSIHASGALLASTGIASVSADSLVLVGSAMPVSTALYFQGTGLSGAGLGVAFGDGLRCASGATVRLATKTNFGGGSQYPGAGDPAVSVRGLVPAAGGARTYQVWYRNSDPGFCTPAFFNLSNALVAAWIP